LSNGPEIFRFAQDDKGQGYFLTGPAFPRFPLYR